MQRLLPLQLTRKLLTGCRHATLRIPLPLFSGWVFYCGTCGEHVGEWFLEKSPVGIVTRFDKLISGRTPFASVFLLNPGV